MKITFDTKEDSEEDIRKVIAMLSAGMNKGPISTVIPEKPKSSIDIFGNSEPKKEEPSNLFNMFNDQPKEKPDLFNIFNEKKESPQDEIVDEKGHKILTY